MIVASNHIMSYITDLKDLVRRRQDLDTKINSFREEKKDLENKLEKVSNELSQFVTSKDKLAQEIDEVNQTLFKFFIADHKLFIKHTELTSSTFHSTLEKYQSIGCSVSVISRESESQSPFYFKPFSGIMMTLS